VAACLPLDGRVVPCPADVTDGRKVAAGVNAVAEQFGSLDAVFHCAGRSARGKLTDTSAEEIRSLLEMNLLGTVHVARAAQPHLARSRGHLVNIGSLASKAAPRFLGGYPASKFALAGYTQQLRLEWQEAGIHVMLVCPGPIAREDAGSRYAEQTKDLPESASQPGGGATLKGLDPQHLAEKILRGCERRKAELVLPRKARLLFAISQLWPALGDWLLLKNSS